ncbi:hypothetical protein [Psychrobacter sp. I-STPA6b]|uniref:hypothetical protein n=1 Tax=Psychrobacter sp. I-STPA6b TaxID=2585718 RepID=UPI001D0C76F8|nr:hypothetical protein [Psychrobacter sp. I-STPA6b]
MRIWINESEVFEIENLKLIDWSNGRINAVVHTVNFDKDWRNQGYERLLSLYQANVDLYIDTASDEEDANLEKINSLNVKDFSEYYNINTCDDAYITLTISFDK